MSLSKLDRAQRHLQELENEISGFFATKPYQIEMRRGAEDRPVYYISSVSPIPDSLPLIAGDVIQNLRSSLDHLTYQLVLKHSPAINSVRHIQFPIASDQTKYGEVKVRQTRGISQPALNELDNVAPYNGGNNTLWQIHELNNIDKHRLLVTVGSAYQSVNLAPSMKEIMRASGFPGIDMLPSFFIRPADNHFPLEAGDELYIDAPGAKPLPDMQFRFNIVFNEVGILEGEPVVDALHAMINEVASTISKFKSMI